MDNVTFIEVDTLDGIREFALIDRGNNEFTTMPKSEYDELKAQQAEHLNGSVDA